jgi:hypothetical protein
MNEAIKAIGMMIISAIVLIVLSIIWFMILLFVVNVAADVVFSESLDPNWGVIAAGIHEGVNPFPPNLFPFHFILSAHSSIMRREHDIIALSEIPNPSNGWIGSMKE